jgi:hypothetical protein
MPKRSIKKHKHKKGGSNKPLAFEEIQDPRCAGCSSQSECEIIKQELTNKDQMEAMKGQTGGKDPVAYNSNEENDEMTVPSFEGDEDKAYGPSKTSKDLNKVLVDSDENSKYDNSVKKGGKKITKRRTYKKRKSHKHNKSKKIGSHKRKAFFNKKFKIIPKRLKRFIEF